MRKPAGFDQAKASLNYEPLALGGHPCVIKAVEESKSKNTNKDMYKIALDIGPGDPQAGYYQRKFDNDLREDRRWPCVMYVVITDDAGNCSRNCASFVTSVEESNPGFAFPWDNAAYLTGKRVGVVFGEEEYLAQDGTIKKGIKPFWFRDVNKVADAPVPKLKEYKPAARTRADVNTFADIKPSEIPFF